MRFYAAEMDRSCLVTGLPPDSLINSRWMDGWHITPTPKTVPWWMVLIIAMTFLSLLFTLSSQFLLKTFRCSVYLSVSFTLPLSVKSLLSFSVALFLFLLFFLSFFHPVFLSVPKALWAFFLPKSEYKFFFNFPQFSFNREWFCTSHDSFEITAINHAACPVPLKIQRKLWLCSIRLTVHKNHMILPLFSW